MPEGKCCKCGKVENPIGIEPETGKQICFSCGILFPYLKGEFD